MNITFPHMGPLSIVLDTLLTGAGVRVSPPPPTSKRTLELGVKHSPETACLPFKITLGNFIEALEAGADTILTCGGVGPCRLGYYAEIQRTILRDLGYNFELMVVEPEVGSVWLLLRRLTIAGGWRRTYHAFQLAGAKLAALDAVERAACFARPRATTAGVEDARSEAIAAVEKAACPDTVAAAVTVFRRRLTATAAPGLPEPLRVGLVGEIYVMLESYINNDILRRLGEMGVEVQPTMLLGDYLRTHVFKNRAALEHAAAVQALAAPFLGHYVGGHGLKSIGHTVAMGQAGFDGMIHLFPFTCMPEVIAKNILPAASRDTGIPVLSLACDEQTGEAGLVTRLEAFVDLLCYRRRKLAGGR